MGEGEIEGGIGIDGGAITVVGRALIDVGGDNGVGVNAVEQSKYAYSAPASV